MHSLPYRVFTVYDVVLITLLLATALYTIPYIQSLEPSTIIIYKNNEIYAKYPLSTDCHFSIQGHEGLMNISIENRKVLITSSPCKKQICVKSGQISKPFQQLICVPSHVLIEIQSKKEKENFDAVTK